MDVFEFIREKKDDLQENTAQFKAMIEPKFKLLSEKINSKITNTLNNPWIEGFNPFEKSYIFSSKKNTIHPNVSIQHPINMKKHTILPPPIQPPKKSQWWSCLAMHA